MRIESFNPVQQVYSTRKATQAASAQKAYQASDNFQMSSLGKDFVTAKNAVKEAPDVRADVVEPLKAKIQNGTYSVSADDFADKLLANM